MVSQATYFLLDTAVFFQKTKLLDTDGDALVLKTNRFWTVGLGLGMLVKAIALVQVGLRLFVLCAAALPFISVP